VFRCADGKFIALGSLEPKFWNQICAALNKPEWANVVLEGKSAHDAVKDSTENQCFRDQTRDYWVAFFRGKEVCVSAVNELERTERPIPTCKKRNSSRSSRLAVEDIHYGEYA
jgi:alpha-methylacyl-CoA racemase